jgi:hypothetical protein
MNPADKSVGFLEIKTMIMRTMRIHLNEVGKKKLPGISLHIRQIVLAGERKSSNAVVATHIDPNVLAATLDQTTHQKPFGMCQQLSDIFVGNTHGPRVNVFDQLPEDGCVDQRQVYLLYEYICG